MSEPPADPSPGSSPGSSSGPSSGSRVEVTDHPDRRRFEVTVDGAPAGFAAYTQRGDGVLDLTHTEVDDAYEGRGVGSTLVREALADVRRRGLRVVPSCPFVASWIERHPDEGADLVVD